MSKFTSFNFSGKKALVRVDFNVPLNAEFQITDDTRMRAAVPTLSKILNDGGSVIIMSHLGRPKEGPTDKYSLRHIQAHLSALLNNVEVKFASDCIGDEAKNAASALKGGRSVITRKFTFLQRGRKRGFGFCQNLVCYGRCLCQ
jgi:phosphoglycerate kinase